MQIIDFSKIKSISKLLDKLGIKDLKHKNDLNIIDVNESQIYQYNDRFYNYDKNQNKITIDFILINHGIKYFKDKGLELQLIISLSESDIFFNNKYNILVKNKNENEIYFNFESCTKLLNKIIKNPIINQYENDKILLFDFYYCISENDDIINPATIIAINKKYDLYDVFYKHLKTIIQPNNIIETYYNQICNNSIMLNYKSNKYKKSINDILKYFVLINDINNVDIINDLMILTIIYNEYFIKIGILNDNIYNNILLNESKHNDEFKILYDKLCVYIDDIFNNNIKYIDEENLYIHKDFETFKTTLNKIFDIIVDLKTDIESSDGNKEQRIFNNIKNILYSESLTISSFKKYLILYQLNSKENGK